MSLPPFYRVVIARFAFGERLAALAGCALRLRSTGGGVVGCADQVALCWA